MKKTLMFFALALLLMLFNACNSSFVDGNDSEITTTSGLMEGLLMFKSMAEFAEYQSDVKIVTSFCAAPSKAMKGMELDKITVRPGVYVALSYNINSRFADKYKGAYEKEQASKATYFTYLYDDTDSALEGIERLGYKLMDDSSGIYCLPEIDKDSGSVVFWSYAYVEDNHLIVANIPAHDDAEKMASFAETNTFDALDKAFIESVDQFIKAPDIMDENNKELETSRK